MTGTAERASHLLEIGRVDQARRLLLDDPGTATDGRALVVLARCHFRCGEERAAVEVARTASVVEPDNPGAWLLQALGLLALDEPVAAREPASLGLALAPDHPGGHQVMARVLAALGRFDAATIHAERARALAPDSPGGWIAQARVDLARRRWVAAAESCRQALERDPGDGEALVLLGVAQAASGGGEGRRLAMETLSGALRERPDADHARRLLRTVALGEGPSPLVLFALAVLVLVTGGVALVVPLAVVTVSGWRRWSTVPADVRRIVVADRATRIRIRLAVAGLIVAWILGLWLALGWARPGAYTRSLMSIEVALEDLADEVNRRGPGYLLSATPGVRPHVLHQRFTIDGDLLGTRLGRSAAANIAALAEVTLLWPPEEEGGYSLIVDATATIDGDRAVITPVGAVLHRPA